MWRKETGGSKLDVTFKTASNSAESVDGEEDSAAAVRLLQEVAMMRQFRHPNIPKLFGVVYENRVSEVSEQVRITVKGYSKP